MESFEHTIVLFDYLSKLWGKARGFRIIMSSFLLLLRQCRDDEKGQAEVYCEESEKSSGG